MPPGFVPTGISTPMLPTTEPPIQSSDEQFPTGFVPMSASVSNAPLPTMPEPYDTSNSWGKFLCRARCQSSLVEVPSQVRATSPRFGSTSSDGNGVGERIELGTVSRKQDPLVTWDSGTVLAPVSPTSLRRRFKWNTSILLRSLAERVDADAYRPKRRWDGYARHAAANAFIWNVVS